MSLRPGFVCLLLLGGACLGRAANPAPELEFRGMVQEGDLCLVNLHDPAAKVSRWMAVGSEIDGLRVVRFDADPAQVVIQWVGREQVLPLKRYLVSVDGPMAPLKLLPVAERVPVSVAPDMPDYLRELPPDARRLLSEVRRRPAIRWPAAPGTAPAIPQ